ncbi:MAG: hypothetical protein ACTSWQ_03220 [Candidatus Thorarchaeota archaeon]
MKTRTRVVDDKGGFVETINEEQSSCLIKQSAKGTLTFEMKIYEEDPIKYRNKAWGFLKEIKAVKEEAKKLGLIQTE